MKTYLSVKLYIDALQWTLFPCIATKAKVINIVAERERDRVHFRRKHGEEWQKVKKQAAIMHTILLKNDICLPFDHLLTLLK